MLAMLNKIVRLKGIGAAVNIRRLFGPTLFGVKFYEPWDNTCRHCSN